MIQRKPFCPECGEIFSGRQNKCPHCGVRFHKAVGEAYGSWSGMGLFDLIPGVRDLPYQVRFTMMIVVVGVIVSLLILAPSLHKLYLHHAR